MARDSSRVGSENYHDHPIIFVCKFVWGPELSELSDIVELTIEFEERP